ncbi:MAG TPA: glycosyl hydrolase, partial [Bryobacteraceae bacterium]|nr:glycosyl hydrolase [Bryobacteraceae bacterium]
DYMGSVIRWAFTDEPAVPSFRPGHQMPWTDALPGIFREKKGYDLIASLPLLLSNPPLMTPEAIGARIDFFDVWSQLFQDAYLMPIRDWCRKYGVLSGGHFGGDDETMGSAIYGYGHILRAMRGMDLPGVDAIWRQVFPDQRNHHFPRYAGSVAHQQGRSRVLTESFGVYGNGLTLAEMKWIVNYQYVRGANMLVMVQYPVGTSGNLITGERPHLDPASPLWRHQGLFQDYTARLGYVLCQGQPDVDVAVYFPVRDFWAAAPARSTPESQAQDEVVLELEKHQVDFDFVDDDLLDDNTGKNGQIQVGPMTYRTLVVSPAHMLPDRTAAAMARFVHTGGTLILAGETPATGPQAKQAFLEHLGTTPLRLGERRKLGKGWAVLCAINDVGRHSPAVITLEPVAEALRATARRTESGRIIVVINESRQWVTTKARLPGGRSLKQLDLDTGLITTAGARLTLPPWGTLCLLTDADTTPAPEPQLPDTKGWSRITGEWQIRPLERVTIESGDFAWSKFPANSWRPAQLGDWKELVGADFSGVAEYRIRFQYAGSEGDGRFLDLGEVAAAAEVWLNDVHLGAKAWQPYWFQTGKALRHGANELRIQVTNTLANYLISPAVRASWAAMQGPGWPGPYDQRANRFESLSTASGLFGPVRITSSH